MMKHKIYNLLLVLVLILSVLPTASAHVDIVDMGHYYDGIDRLGYVDYQNVANYTVESAILVFVDGEIAAGKILNMKIRYVAGFRCSPIKTLEFPITEAEGKHTIVVYIYSMNSSTERVYEYTGEGVEEVVDVEESEIEKDWLTCWKCGGP
jgi:hypothetical protein